MASTHWKVERVVAIAMVGIMPTALFVQGALMDHVFTTFVYLHGHWLVSCSSFCTSFLSSWCSVNVHNRRKKPPVSTSRWTLICVLVDFGTSVLSPVHIFTDQCCDLLWHMCVESVLWPTNCFVMRNRCFIKREGICSLWNQFDNPRLFCDWRAVVYNKEYVDCLYAVSVYLTVILWSCLVYTLEMFRMSIFDLCKELILWGE